MSFATEPALLLAGAAAVVEALLVLLVSFGVPITSEQKGAINALVTVVVTLLTGVAIRSQVTPVAMLPAAIPAPRSSLPAPPH